jgi:ABC-2 type transport system permease protein
MNRIGHVLGIFRREIITETLRVVRDPSFMAPSIGFPVAFYVLFTLVLPVGGGDPSAARVLFANYSAFGVVGAMLFGCAILLSNDRDLGVLKLKRSTPLPVWVFFAAKLISALLLGALVFAAMALVAVTLVGVRFPAHAWLGLAASMLAGGLAFGAIGLAIGAWTSANAAPGIVNLLFLPASAIGGLWFPMTMFPEFVRKMALSLPTFYFGELSRDAIGFGVTSPLLCVLGLAVFLVLGGFIATQGMRRRPF